MASKNTSKVNERLALAEQAAAAGNYEAAVNYAKAASAFSRSDASNANVAKVTAAYQDALKASQAPAPKEQPKGNADSTPQVSAEEKAYWENRTRLDNEAAASEREGAKAFLQSLLSQYGLGSLAPSIEGLVNQWGNNQAVISVKLRDTDQYKKRFKGLLDLQSRGVTDVANEGQYLDLESRYRQIFRDNGISDFLGTAGSDDEIANIGDIVSKYSLSVNEVGDRVTDAVRVVNETAPEVRDALTRYYNVDSATLVKYVLDPTRTSAQVNRIANAAVLGGYAAKQGLGLSQSASEAIANQRAGDQDLSGITATNALSGVASVRNSAARLANIETTDLTDDEVALGQLGLSDTAARKVAGLQSRERARFGGSGGITRGSLARPNAI